MSKEIIVVKGFFSNISIQLSDSTLNKLAVTETGDNPLALIESDLKDVLDRFERKYFELMYPPESEQQ